MKALEEAPLSPTQPMEGEEVRDREACVYGCSTPAFEVYLTAIVACFPISRQRLRKSF